jgi:hypothetical protein
VTPGRGRRRRRRLRLSRDASLGLGLAVARHDERSDDEKPRVVGPGLAALGIVLHRSASVLQPRLPTARTVRPKTFVQLPEPHGSLARWAADVVDHVLALGRRVAADAPALEHSSSMAQPRAMAQAMSATHASTSVRHLWHAQPHSDPNTRPSRKRCLRSERSPGRTSRRPRPGMPIADSPSDRT